MDEWRPKTADNPIKADNDLVKIKEKMKQKQEAEMAKKREEDEAKRKKDLEKALKKKKMEEIRRINRILFAMFKKQNQMKKEENKETVPPVSLAGKYPCLHLYAHYYIC